MGRAAFRFRLNFLRAFFSAIAISLALLLTGTAPALALVLKGKVVASDNDALPNYRVSLYGSYVGAGGPLWLRLGSAKSNAAGAFRITYTVPAGVLNERQLLLFVQARRGRVMLTSAIGRASNAPTQIVVNPRTTVAAATAFAQFVNGQKIEGNTYGMINAVHMAANLANPLTGSVGRILARTPNGTETSTLPTFNSLTNVVQSCVVNTNNCKKLFSATTPAGGPAPTNVLQAIANIAKYPSYPGYPDNARDPLFQLSSVTPVDTPALADRPTSWLLFLKFTGGFYSEQDASNLLNGPGNVGIDEKGYAWVNDNYVPRKGATSPAPAGG